MTWFWQRPLKHQVLLTLIWCAVLAGFVVFADWYVVSPYGYGGVLLLFISIFVFLPWILAWLALPASVLLLLWPKARRVAVSFICCSLVCLPFGLLAFHLMAPFRHDAFKGLAIRSEPLVRAIHQYTDEQGQPPPNLEALVPAYLPSVPGTGMPAYPDYRYSTGHDLEEWDGNPWVLWVFTPAAAINFDKFLYFPLQNYPSNGYGGSLEPIGNWAYVHE